MGAWHPHLRGRLRWLAACRRRSEWPLHPQRLVRRPAAIDGHHALPRGRRLADQCPGAPGASALVLPFQLSAQQWAPAVPFLPEPAPQRQRSRFPSEAPRIVRRTLPDRLDLRQRRSGRRRRAEQSPPHGPPGRGQCSLSRRWCPPGTSGTGRSHLDREPLCRRTPSLETLMNPVHANSPRPEASRRSTHPSAGPLLREFDGPAPWKFRNSTPMEVTASAFHGSSPMAGRRAAAPIRQPLSAGVCHRAGVMSTTAIAASMSHLHSQRN